MKAPTSNDTAMTKKAFSAIRRASSRRVSAEAYIVMLRNTSAVPGGLITGNNAARTSRKVSTIPIYPL